VNISALPSGNIAIFVRKIVFAPLASVFGVSDFFLLGFEKKVVSLYRFVYIKI